MSQEEASRSEPVPPAEPAVEPFSVRITNRWTDVYWGNVYLSFISPFHFILLGLLGWLIYSLALPWLREGEWVPFAIVAGGATVLVLGIVHTIPLLVLLYGSVFKKLQGVLGDHEFTFAGDQFVERTDFNETKSSTTAIHRVLETRQRFFVVLPGPQAHVIPKRGLDGGTLAELRRRFGASRPVRSFVGPFFARVILVISLLVVLVASSLTRYEIQRDVLPFQACWNEQSLYLLGGEQAYGTKYNYAAMVTSSYGSFQSMSSTDASLWTIADGEVRRHSLERFDFLGNAVLREGILYLNVYDENSGTSILRWSGDRFVESPGMTPESLAKIASSGSNCVLWTSEDSWREVSAGSNELQVPLAGRAFRLTFDERVTDEETFSRDISLVGAWRGEGGEETTLFQLQTGSITVGGADFEARFTETTH